MEMVREEEAYPGNGQSRKSHLSIISLLKGDIQKVLHMPCWGKEMMPPKPKMDGQEKIQTSKYKLYEVWKGKAS